MIAVIVCAAILAWMKNEAEKKVYMHFVVGVKVTIQTNKYTYITKK